MTIDLLLTIGHHLSVFTLVGIIAAEFVLLRPGLAGGRIGQLARIDAAYGGVAALVVVVGVLRVIYGAAGWEYYAGNHAFWGKMAAFVVVGLLSVQPTIAIRNWARAERATPDYAVPAAELARGRRFLHAEVAVLALIPVFAAVMARG
jgi:putative membrane protein